MKIFNIMLGAKLGGLEQVFLDYSHALSQHHHQVISVIHPQSGLRDKIQGPYLTLSNFNQFDPLAILKLRGMCLNEKPDCVITHGNRATSLMKRTRLKLPRIAVSHNYKMEPLIGSDAMIVLTPDMQEKAIIAGQGADRIHVLPNMIRTALTTIDLKPFKNPPVIGFLGRFDPKKGADLLLHALVNLKQNGIEFKAIMGGDGPQKTQLLKLTQELGLNPEISYVGWVHDLHSFFDQIDILAIPSHSEAFGLVLLEGFARGKTVVATATPGPLAIGTHAKDILLSPIGNAKAMAENLMKLIQDPELARRLASEGAITVKNYTPEIFGERLNKIMLNFIEKARK